MRRDGTRREGGVCRDRGGKGKGREEEAGDKGDSPYFTWIDARPLPGLHPWTQPVN